MLVASMRAGGVRAGMGELLAAHRALAAVDPSSRREAYFALRAALCSRHEDLEVFDAAFEVTFGAEPLSEAAEALGDVGHTVLPKAPAPAPPAAPAPSPGEEVELEGAPAAWSDVELLKARASARYTEAGGARPRGLGPRLGVRGPTGLSRRRRAPRRRGAHPDPRPRCGPRCATAASPS